MQNDTAMEWPLYVNRLPHLCSRFSKFAAGLSARYPPDNVNIAVNYARVDIIPCTRNDGAEIGLHSLTTLHICDVPASVIPCLDARATQTPNGFTEPLAPRLQSLTIHLLVWTWLRSVGWFSKSSRECEIWWHEHCAFKHNAVVSFLPWHWGRVRNSNSGRSSAGETVWLNNF